MNLEFPSLRDQIFSEIDKPLKLVRNRVLLAKISQMQSKILWTPPEKLPILGEVLAVGAGEVDKHTGHTWPNYMKPGDRIIVNPNEGVEVVYRGVPALIVREDEVLGVFDEEPCGKELFMRPPELINVGELADKVNKMAAELTKFKASTMDGFREINEHIADLAQGLRETSGEKAGADST